MKVKDTNEFYLRDTRSDVGSTCMFWANDGCGYTSDLDKAHVFDKKEAQDFADQGLHFIPLSKHQVDALAVRRVDHQYLDSTAFFDVTKGIVIRECHYGYDGNDIYFRPETGGRPTPNLSEALVFFPNSIEEVIKMDGKPLAKDHMDKISRRCIQSCNVNKRKMTTAAGIKCRSPRASRSSGRTRGNCPTCGKITWSFNPYHNEYCNYYCESTYKYDVVF